MAFQDFDYIQERRKAERKQKRKKLIIIGVVSIIVLAGVIVAAAFTLVQQSKGDADKSKGGNKKGGSRSPGDSDHNKEIATSQKAIKAACSSTNYNVKCESTLRGAVKAKPKSTGPKDFIKILINAASEEVSKALTASKKLKFETPEKKGAFEDCKALIADAQKDLESSIAIANETDVKKLAAKTSDFNSWLSAVITYHETCIDGFGDEKSKSALRKIFKSVKELTSNSLALSTEAQSFFSQFSNSNKNPAKRNLLADMQDDGFPSWINNESRRLLKGKAKEDMPTPDVTVAKDGSGQFATITKALEAMPKKYEGRYIIYVKEGVYDEMVTITADMANVTMYGEGSKKSIITGSKSFADGTRILKTSTFTVLGNGFFGKAMGFRNTAGADKRQAVAARVQADFAVFTNCRFEGYQYTLYALAHRQFYKSCVITGTVDIIVGDAVAVFQNCDIFLRKPMDEQSNTVTAQGRVEDKQHTGFVLQSCHIQPDEVLTPVKSKVKSYLGRPWKEYSRTVVMESIIEDFIAPEGWTPFMGNYGTKTCYFGEYSNKGPGSSTKGRVKWPCFKVLGKTDAAKFTAGPFYENKKDWLVDTGVQVKYNFFDGA